MIYTETEKKELDEVRRVFAEHLRQSPDYELLWSDKVGYVWLAIGLEPLYVDTGRRIESAEDLCRECLESIGMDTLYLTDNDHGLENADPLERAEIRRRWKPSAKPVPPWRRDRYWPDWAANPIHLPLSDSAVSSNQISSIQPDIHLSDPR